MISIKKVFLKIVQFSQENTCARVSLLIKLQASGNFIASGCNCLKKETPAQVFSCEFCKIFKNSFFTKHLWMTASVHFNLISIRIRVTEFHCSFKILNKFYQILFFIIPLGLRHSSFCFFNYWGFPWILMHQCITVHPSPSIRPLCTCCTFSIYSRMTQ